MRVNSSADKSGLTNTCTASKPSPMQTIHPFIVGRGRAGQAIHEAIAVLSSLSAQSAEISWAAPVWLSREAPLVPAASGLSLAFIANPNAFHAARILEADRAGFAGIACEKPACISEAEATLLRKVKTPTAIFHGFRQMWGPQTMREMIASGDLGELISVEGRYWQSSAAERAQKHDQSGGVSTSWKNDAGMIGPSDTLLDLGTHWADLAVFLLGQPPARVSGWASYVNAEQPHRDTHVHLLLETPSGTRAFGSISKTVHGATNILEMTVIGAKRSLSWSMQNPDELLIGEGRDRRVLTRKSNDLGSQKAPFHGMGWLEGYIEITRQLVIQVAGLGAHRPYPDLHGSAELVRQLLSSGVLR